MKPVERCLACEAERGSHHEGAASLASSVLNKCRRWKPRRLLLLFHVKEVTS
jgi:hypothetical protein